MSMDLLAYEFDEFDPIGAGAHATVFSAIHVPTGKRVALKRIQLKDNMEITLAMLRECHILMEMKHPNILRLERVLVHGGFLYLVLEKMVSSMRGHFESSTNEYQDPKMIKKYLKQILSGVSYLHSHEVLHRDLKPENLLISGEEIKISDFGSARGFVGVEPTKLTPAIVTVDYRAPELLLGSRDYSKAVDMWAVGCIFAEMWNMKPLFGPESDVDLGLEYVKSLFGGDSDVELGLDYSTVVLGKIFRALGTPNEDTWPGVSKLKPTHKEEPQVTPQGLGTLVPRLDDEAAGKDLLLKLLCLNPEGRISAEEALKHAYFADP